MPTQVTGQVEIDSYADTGLFVALDLANEPALRPEADATRDEIARAVARILSVDPPSVAGLRPSDVPGFRGLALELRLVFQALDDGDVDDAADRLNDLLARYPAHPHLAKEDGVWRMHHHPRDLAVLPMWAATCAEATARKLGEGHAERFGICEASGCGRALLDGWKYASRRVWASTGPNLTSSMRRRRSRRSSFRHFFSA
jgi:predicted RNA-binding Zn ribbon-like protein